MSVDWPRPTEPLMVETLEFIERFFAMHGCTPTIREVSEELGLASASTAHQRVQRLVHQGYLRRVGLRLALVHWEGSDAPDHSSPVPQPAAH